jgi:circadian clock protein KaiB
MTDDAPSIDFRLYVAGNAPNSWRAVANLNALCRRYLPNRYRIEVIDVFKHPRRALEDGVMLTPNLIVASASPPLTVVGDLSDSTSVLQALGIERKIDDR